MKDLQFVLQHFFTHKDFLPDASQIPGTLFTPMQIIFEVVLLLIILVCAAYVSRRKHLICPVLKALLLSLIGFEVIIDLWDSLAGMHHQFDFSTGLPLYPCSIFMYVLPLVIWGKGIWKEMGCGYICTLGLTGALINFLYPISRLMDYSCISFPAFHTFFYHGSMLFTALVLFLTGTHQLSRFSKWWTPFLASVPGLIFSIPANIVNYSPIHADYMYFTGQHFLSKMVFGDHAAPLAVTRNMYVVYLLGPVLFYWIPWLLRRGASYIGQFTNTGWKLLKG